MNTGMRKAALNAYGKQNLAAQIEAASPHRLILMLFEGAIKSCNLAKLYMRNGEIANKGMAFSRAIAIIQEGLRLSLDKEQGGELAANLDALYDYMGRKLLQANMHNDLAAVDEVLQLLSGLKESWEQIGLTQNAPADGVPLQADRATPLSYGKA